MRVRAFSGGLPSILLKVEDLSNFSQMKLNDNEHHLIATCGRWEDAYVLLNREILNTPLHERLKRVVTTSRPYVSTTLLDPFELAFVNTTLWVFSSIAT